MIELFARAFVLIFSRIRPRTIAIGNRDGTDNETARPIMGAVYVWNASALQASMCVPRR